MNFHKIKAMFKILLFEDNEYIRDNATEILELQGYEVLSSPNGRNALSLVRNFRPEIIFCDIMMPEVDGYAVFNTIKADPEAAHIPFIFLTASVEKRDVEAALKKGAQGYIKKPFEPAELFECIETLLK